MVLQEMLDKMTGVQCRDKLMEGNFYCDCGGLYFYLKNLGIEKEFKYFKKPAAVLMKFFAQGKDDTAITLSLMVMFMLKKRYIVYNSRDMSSVRMISFYLDLVCSIYQQFVMFLNFYAEKKDLYCKLLMDVKQKWFIEKFHLNPIDVFELYRPTLKAVYELTKEEYEEKISHATEESEEILKSALRRAQLKEEEILREADEKAARTLERAEEEIEREKKRAINEVKNEVSELAIGIATAVIERDVKAEDHAKLIDDFIDNMGNE